jgi:transposase
MEPFFDKGDRVAPQNKILNHPDKEEIIKWLKVDGTSVREVEKRLAQRYPKKNQNHLRVSFSTIQSFKKNYLNLEGKALQDIKEASKLTRKWAKKQEALDSLAETDAYKQALMKAVESEIDTRQEIAKVFAIIDARMEVLFNKASEVDFIDKDVEKFLLDYLKQLSAVIDQHKKYEEGYREQVDINVNVNVMTEQIQVMREAVRETLADVDPALTLTFMGKLNEKMRRLSVGGDVASDRHSAILDNALGAGEVRDVEFE